MKRLEFSEEVKQIIDKSTFISQLHDIGHKDDIHFILNDLKKMHPKASHIVFGYVIDSDHYGYDDQGEPKGTAGQPIMEVLKKQHVSNTLCTVIRYFGGQLLGAQGLTKAYRDMAYEAFNKALFKTLEQYDVYEITLSYALFETIKPTLHDIGIVEDIKYLEYITFKLLTKLDKNALKTLLYGIHKLTYLGLLWQ